jgi:inner membrane transporter RhtA
VQKATARRPVPAPVFVIGAAVSVQGGAAVAKSLFPELGPPGVVFLRLLFGGVVLWAFARPVLRGRSTRDLALVALLGLVLVCMNLSFYESLDRLPLGIAVTVEFVGPLGVAVAGSRRALDLVWVALAGGGILLLAAPGGGSASSAGVAFALLAGCFWAAYILINERVGRAFSGGGGLALAMAVGALLLVPVGVAAAGADLLDVRVLAIGAAVAMLSSAIPYSLELEALRRTSSRVFGVLMSLEPAVAALVGLAVLGQLLGVRELAGIALVVVASVGVTRATTISEPPEA